MRRALEVLTNISVLVAALFMIFVLYGRIGVRQDYLNVGATMPAIKGITWANHEQTLVLALRKGCHYCEESMPFYRDLSNLSQGQMLKTYLVAVLPDSQADVHSLMASQSLHFDSVPLTPLKSLKINGTPTLILVDRAGKVKRVWAGELTRTREGEVLAAIKPS